MRVEVERDVAAPRHVVWAVLTDWERQPEWMVDALAVEVLTPARVGEGVVVRCPTLLLGMVADDVLRVTAWDEPSRLEIVHLGSIITGTAAFELQPLGAARTRLRWWEEVDPPLGRLGEWGASLLVRPVVARVFARSLTRLARLAEAAATEASPGSGAGA